VGLVVLWATEECYLRAWRFARESMPKEGGVGEREKDVMRRVFIPNWSSEEFEGFVNRLRGLVDEIEIEEGSWLWKECEKAWRQVVWVEGMFWPDVDVAAE
jgi:thiaminase